MEHSLGQPHAPWRPPIKFTGAVALLSGMFHVAWGQTEPLAPSAFLWGSASNASVSLTFGSAQHRTLVVFGLAGNLATRERTAMMGVGVRFNAGTTRTSLLVEGLVGSGGWAGRLAVIARSDLGQASAFGRVWLTHALGPVGDPPAVQGTVVLQGRLSAALRWGTAYGFDVKAHEVGEHRLGPSLEVRLLRAAIRFDFGRGLGRAADEVCVTVLVAG